ncbi:MAG: hypothetical protein F2806_06455 [Actinobacteria bacterium]|uniref:Unannotated protein n=1 Tax=freshwater metagenome TaxID=449393 RepID=A0A6J7GGB4_9ZZZZ|nr:hypothetical protein [Actinomycetota bacterium]
MTATGSMLAFHHLTVAVKDLPAAVDDWEALLGWEKTKGERAIFNLTSGFIELVEVDDGPTGIVEVAVLADDVVSIAEAIERSGGVVHHDAEGNVHIEPAVLSGVPLVLMASQTQLPKNIESPYVRFSHLVVAVSEYQRSVAKWTRYFAPWPQMEESSGEISEHVPVGSSWFGLTATGGDAGALERFIARSGEGIYAVGVVVEDLAATVSILQSRGARLVRDDSSNQVFVHPATTHGLLLDLVQQ